MQIDFTFLGTFKYYVQGQLAVVDEQPLSCPLGKAII